MPAEAIQQNYRCAPYSPMRPGASMGSMHAHSIIVQVDKFSGQTGRLRRGNRLDQARIVIPDIADAYADRPADHVVGGVGGQQRLELRLVRRFFPEPPDLAGTSEARFLRL
jgi:hypothetical protein